MPRFCLNFRDTFLGHRCWVGNGSDDVVIRLGDATELHVSPNKGTFNFQLPFVAAYFGPNVFEFLAAIPVVEWAEGHGRRPTPRFINIVMPIYGDNLGNRPENQSFENYFGSGRMAVRIKITEAPVAKTKNTPT